MALWWAACWPNMLVAQQTHPFVIPQSSNAPEVLLAFIEIPKGSAIKYEVDPVSGHLKVDRILPKPFVYPAHYGFLPAMPAADGDLLDVLIVTDHPLLPNTLIEVHPVGLIKMRDGGVADHKVLAIPRTEKPSDGIDETLLQAIEAFFTGYKTQDHQPNPIEWLGVWDATDTKIWLEANHTSTKPASLGTEGSKPTDR